MASRIVQDHIRKRQTLLGRWVPFALYALNLLLLLVTGLAFKQGSLLALIALPLPALVLYWLRTRPPRP